MKNILLVVFLSIVFITSCSKNEEPVDTTRGNLSQESQSIGTIKKTDIGNLLKLVASEYATQIDTEFDVELIKLNYYTIDYAGKTTKASGLLLIPENIQKKAPLMSFQHGTVLNKDDVPSRKKGAYEAALLFASKGYVVACPDYLGLGDSPGLHPYVHANSEATAVIDMLRASKKVCTDKNILLSSQVFLAGYSQGGHATLAALKMIKEQHHDEFNVTACAPASGPYDLSGTQMDYVLKDAPYANPGYLPYVIFSYNMVYQLYSNISDVFANGYYEKFKPFFTGESRKELSEIDNIWQGSRIPAVVLQAEILKDIRENPANKLKTALNDNNLYNWTPVTPINLCHCDSDKHVPFQNSVKAYEYFRKNGSPEVLLTNPLPGGTHTTCAMPALFTIYFWFESKRMIQ